MDSMPNANQLTNLIKRAAVDAVDASKPLELRYGVVTRANPLRVQIELKLVLEAVHLVVPQSLTNHTVSMTIGGTTQDVTVRNALRVNDKVSLLREKGGKRYYILDRV